MVSSRFAQADGMSGLNVTVPHQRSCIKVALHGYDPVIIGGKIIN